jgi:hypothetical protein
MEKRSLGIMLAAAAMLATTGLTWADSSSSSAGAAAPAPAMSASTENAPPLMYGLDQVKTGDSSVGQNLQSAGIQIGGYGDLGYTKDFGNSNPIPGRTFTSEAHNNLTLNQIDLYIARTINLRGAGIHNQGFELGGKIDVLYGYDGDFIHSNGLNSYHSWNENIQSHPLYQFDLQQMYLDAGFALGGNSAMLIRFGKYDSPMGYERINPTENAFYSHSFAFGNLTPYTQTGLLAKVVIGQDLSFWGAISRGWNQTFKDNNSGLDGLVGVGLKVNNQWDAKVNFSVGPQDSGTNNPERVVIEPTITWVPPILNNALSITSDTVLYYDGAGNTVNGQDGAAFDEALYQSYRYNRFITYNFREEYAYFGTGVVEGLGNQGTVDAASDFDQFGETGNALNLGELTVGISLTPFPDSPVLRTLVIRPELREDLADHALLSGGKHYQTTFGVDAVYSF